MRFLIINILILSLFACSREPALKNSRVVTVESNSFANTLFYSGTIQPLKTLVVPSPVDGVVIDMPFQYGEPVKAGQLLYVLSSTKFLTDYKSALMQYIKAKSDFNNNQTLLSEAKFLHKNELISDDDFKMKKSTYYASQLALLQAKDTLETLLRQLDIKNVNLYNLTIADVDKITQAMHLQMSSENLRILAPADGIILSANKSDDEIKKTHKGDAVKQGDILAVIGDMSGISVRIKVNELTVNQLNVGQKVKVTGIAFPDHSLDGEIQRVDRQGESVAGGQPGFNVEIGVLKLSEAQQKLIHAGMSGKIQIDIKQESQILVPITAVNEKNGHAFIQAYDDKSGKFREVAIKAGKTTIDSIAVLSGLKAGDKIVVPN